MLDKKVISILFTIILLSIIYLWSRFLPNQVNKIDETSNSNNNNDIKSTENDDIEEVIDVLAFQSETMEMEEDEEEENLVPKIKNDEKDDDKKDGEKHDDDVEKHDDVENIMDIFGQKSQALKDFKSLRREEHKKMRSMKKILAEKIAEERGGIAIEKTILQPQPSLHFDEFGMPHIEVELKMKKKMFVLSKHKKEPIEEKQNEEKQNLLKLSNDKEEQEDNNNEQQTVSMSKDKVSNIIGRQIEL